LWLFGVATVSFTNRFESQLVGVATVRGGRLVGVLPGWQQKIIALVFSSLRYLNKKNSANT
jgi:hypothetical protein